MIRRSRDFGSAHESFSRHCLEFLPLQTSARSEGKYTEVLDSVRQLMSTQPDLSAEDASNYVAAQFIANCYLRVAEDKALLGPYQQDESNFFKSDDYVSKVYARPGVMAKYPRHPAGLSQRQWAMLNKIIEGEVGRKRQVEVESYKPLGVKTSHLTNAMIMLVFFTIFFGGCYVVITQLAKGLQESPEKAARRAAKRAKKLQ